MSSTQDRIPENWYRRGQCLRLSVQARLEVQVETPRLWAWMALLAFSAAPKLNIGVDDPSYS